MQHRQLFSVMSALVSVAACTFGADDFKLVAGGAGGPSGSGGSAGTSQAGSSATSGGSSGTAGTSAVGGSNAGGSAGGNAGAAGAGGAGGSPPGLSCAPQRAPLTLFSTTDLLGSSSAVKEPEEVRLLPANPNMIVALATIDDADRNTRLLMRAMGDNQSNPLRGFNYWTAQGYFKIAGAWVRESALIVAGADGRGIFELKIPLTNTDSDFDVASASVTIHKSPDDCVKPDWHIRDIEANYTTGLAFAVTCARSDQMQFSLHVHTPDRALTPIAPAANQETFIIRQYIRSSDIDLMIVGSEVGPVLSYRLGKTIDELKTVHDMRFSSGPDDWSTFLFRPLPNASGVYVLGSRFKDPNSSTPLVPADVFAGTISAANYADLSKVPPPSLLKIATYTKATDVGLPEDIAFNGPYAYGASVEFLTKAHVYLWATKHDGTPLLSNFEVYKADTNDQLSFPRIAPLGFGVVLSWFEKGQINARPVACIAN